MNAPAADRRWPARGLDPALLSSAIGLAIAGVAISGSARAFGDASAGPRPEGVGEALAHLGIGLVLMGMAALIDYRRLARPAVVWGALAGIVLLLVAAPLAAPEIKGTHRWIRFGGTTVQPSELAKPVLVLVVAAALARAGDAVRTWSGLARPLAAGGIIVALVLAGRDLGTPVLMGTVILAMAYAAGARHRHLAALAAGAALVFAPLVLFESYRSARFAGWGAALRFPFGTLDGVHLQVRQSLAAIGSGGVWGKGFGMSTQKAFFLPEADNDFVFAIVGEELGLIGALAVLAAFLVLAWRGFAAADRATEPFGRLVALGATWSICAQALCHLAVATALLPPKGLPLPFLSTGGSSLVSSCVLVGLVLNVSLRGRRHAG
ncbi:MAG: hypothetical protein D6718_04810 [Acidobacteria bacterium]|nr:MAG: hypothetical protein D6718_04810 [Acidobacteriota bacterium]